MLIVEPTSSCTVERNWKLFQVTSRAAEWPPTSWPRIVLWCLQKVRLILAYLLCVSFLPILVSLARPNGSTRHINYAHRKSERIQQQANDAQLSLKLSSIFQPVSFLPFHNCVGCNYTAEGWIVDWKTNSKPVHSYNDLTFPLCCSSMRSGSVFFFENFNKHTISFAPRNEHHRRGTQNVTSG